MFPIAFAFLLAPILAQAATFTGCMTGSIPHKSKSHVELPNVEGTDCIDQCTARGFEYSFSYFHDVDAIHYCHCDSSATLSEHKDYLQPAYEGERCYENDATVYHLHTELTFTHCANSLASEHTILGLIVDTPAQCFEHCSSTGAYLLAPPTGVKGGQYECFCQQPEIQEVGISSFCDSAAYRRFDAPVKSNRNRLTFQSAGNDVQKTMTI
ncbi:uncharacterized protein IL334_002093 [Kwoniella shivajii]|uniref:WSC domain-containing protein n=1 Tax=Kwoniella shivajii TaxID=564305 RepID=A0ABZ1CWS7_9TREE|nr:hypothetical protein IL334_002093 [Kwoniella shivajii]